MCRYTSRLNHHWYINLIAYPYFYPPGCLGFQQVRIQMSRWKLGFEWLVDGLFHLRINELYWGYNPLILTFDPNFLGHPSSCWVFAGQLI